MTQVSWLFTYSKQVQSRLATYDSDEGLFVSWSMLCTPLLVITVWGMEWRFFMVPDDVGGIWIWQPAPCNREMSIWGLSWNSWLRTQACNVSSVILESSDVFCPLVLSRSRTTSENFLHCLSLRSVCSQSGGRLRTSLATKEKKYKLRLYRLYMHLGV